MQTQRDLDMILKIQIEKKHAPKLINYLRTLPYIDEEDNDFGSVDDLEKESISDSDGHCDFDILDN